MIQYKRMSLFDAPTESAIFHSCNALGIWGAGIAKEFKERFPNTYKQYNKMIFSDLHLNTTYRDFKIY